MNNPNISNLSKIDQLIRQGQIKTAAKEIFLIYKTQKIPDQNRLEIANLARRSGQPLLSLKILSPFIKKNLERLRPLLPSEKISYAAGLISLGALTEAEDMLLGPDLNDEPMRWFYLGLSAMAEWNYIKAKKYLQKYLKCKTLTGYQIHTANLNLATSLLVLGENHSAGMIIQSEINQLNANTEALLISFFKELEIQWLIAEKKYDQAIVVLNSLVKYLKNQSTLYDLNIQKWNLAVQFYAKKMTEPELKKSLDQLEIQAQTNEAFELLREIDFYRALFLKDQQAWSRIYFGTESPSYIQRIESNLGKWPGNLASIWIPQTWQKNKFSLETNDQKNQEIFDKNDDSLLTRTSTSNSEKNTLNVCLDIANPKLNEINSGSLQHQLLWLIAKDLYRPISLGALFHGLYPNEKFDPWTSKERVLKLVNRTQKSIDKKFPEQFKILQRKNKFYFFFNRPIGLIQKYFQFSTAQQNDPFFCNLFFNFKYNSFKNSDVGQLTSLSAGQVLERINGYIDKGWIQTNNKKAGHRNYRIKNLKK